MRTTLHNLRQKPEHVRKKYAYTTAAVISLSIFFVWGTAMVISKPLAYKPPVEEAQETNERKPFQELTKAFQTGLAGVGASLEEVQSVSEGRYEGDARLEIVETGRSTTIEEEERETVYTF